MPPKSAAATERLKKELAAQRARAAALQHLDSTGSGPSHRERAEQQQLRQQKTANATSIAAQRRVAGALPREQTAAEKYDPRVRDNTLHAVALRRAQELQTTQKLTAQAETYHTGHGLSSTLPDGWKEATDDASGDTYYWNEVRKALYVGIGYRIDLDSGLEVTDPSSGDVYYWNRKTDATTWTRPAARSVALGTTTLVVLLTWLGDDINGAFTYLTPVEQALEAKAKLDGILRGCGKPEVKNPANNTQASTTRSTKRPESTAHNGSSGRESSSWQANKRSKRSDGGTIDPMDPTGRGGKWSDGLVDPSERAADSTVTGPLYQQRPYPAPGQVLRKEAERK
ncbi:hypothetical protein BBJ28_00002765 [Nothophytophthora sp. Chile5]|nr:hypothetical protein BBJ28_00002765 [Nothophytophthora sp. Chile5]